MLIKSADDREPHIAALEGLVRRPDVDADARRRIESEIKRIRAGMAGERDAAYEIEFVLAQNRNRMTIHDLRIEVDGRVAQIDHLVINRLLDVWVIETKHFSEGVAVNEHGEWTAFYGHRPYGIPSPIEQNRRHVAVLADAFAKGLVPLPKRLGMVTIKPKFYSLVLVSNNARISRPKGKAAAAAVQGLETVIKVDRFEAALDKAYDEHSLAVIGKLISFEQVEALARSLAGLHVPATFDWAAKFGLPAELPPEPVISSVVPTSSPPTYTPAPAASSAPSATSVCASCDKPVSAAVIAYCAENAERFGGLTLCYACQRSTRKRPR